MSNQSRTPAGVPTGGQFAASARDEADVRLAETKPVPLAAPRVGLPQVSRNDDGLVEIRSFACETHDVPGSCTVECASLVAAMSGDSGVDYDPTGASYGPDRPVTAYDYDEDERAAVAVTTCPHGETQARAVQPGEFVVVDGEPREVDSVAPVDNRGMVTIDFASFDREPDGSPSAYLSRAFKPNEVFALSDGWDG